MSQEPVGKRTASKCLILLIFDLQVTGVVKKEPIFVRKSIMSWHVCEKLNTFSFINYKQMVK